MKTIDEREMQKTTKKQTSKDRKEQGEQNRTIDSNVLFTIDLPTKSTFDSCMAK